MGNEALIRLAQDKKIIVWMNHGIGEFVVRNTTLVSLTLEAPQDQAILDRLQASFTISRHRTLDQDAAFGIRHIVDIALKALSPGINDTTTAVMCVDFLTTVLAWIAPLQIPSSHRCEQEKLRVIAKYSMVGPVYARVRSRNSNTVNSCRWCEINF